MAKILLIDLSHLFWSGWHATKDGPVSEAGKIALQSVQRACNFAKFDGVAICCDSGRSFRKDLAESYKANRPEKDQQAIGELQRLQERLVADAFLVWNAPGFEADDIIATAATAARRAGHSVVIASADKDLFQLINDIEPSVSMLSTRTWTAVDQTTVMDKIGVQPPYVADWLALVGDSSDNIKGAPGIGPVKATELLKEHGSLRDILRTVMVDDGKFKPAVAKSLRENMDQIDLARRLVALRVDVPGIDVDEIFKRREQAPISKEEIMDMDEPYQEFDEPASTENANGEAPRAQQQVAPPAVIEPDIAPSTALAIRPARFEYGLQPTSIGGAYRLAVGLYNSRLYQKLGSPEAIMAVILRGREMGIGAATALDVFHVIEGKPALHAHFIIARAMAHPDCEYFHCEETSAERCTYEVKSRRNPRPTRLTYTYKQAEQAGLTASRPGKGPSNWVRRPDEMCRKTCGVQIARIVFPEAAMGLYSVEELDGYSADEVGAAA